MEELIHRMMVWTMAIFTENSLSLSRRCRVLLIFGLVCLNFCLSSETEDCLEAHRSFFTAFLKSQQKESVHPAYPRILTKDEQLPAAMERKIQPRFDTRVTGQLIGKGGVKLHYAKWEVPKELGAIVFVPGLTQSYHYHRELIHDLVEEGYSVYAIDPRGQGYSEHLGKRPQVAHVDHFSEYIDDMNLFLTKIVAQKKHDRILGLGYSMGGLITTLTAERFPGAYQAYSAVVPPYQIKSGGIPSFAIKSLLAARIALGMSRSYIPFLKDLDVTVAEAHLLGEGNRKALERDLRLKFPDLTMAGPSNRWLWTTLAATKEMDSIARKIETPNLLVSTSDDTIVFSDAIRRFAGKSLHSSLHDLAGAGHHVFLEPDSKRHSVVTNILRFFVNPIPLDSPATANEIAPIIQRSVGYLKRGDTAMARYALDEAIRIYQWKKKSLRQFDLGSLEKDLAEQNAALWTLINKAPDEEKKLYLFLHFQRERELLRRYQQTTPKE